MLKSCTSLVMATITIAMASLPIPVFGNGFFLEKPHLPVNGDCVLKYHYFFQECDQGKAVWDFSHAIPKGESHYMQWINLGDSVFVKIENGMQSNFRIQNDTLYWAGYENPLLRVEDSIAPIMAIKSSSKHNSITSAYHFKGMYCGNNYVGLIGHFAITTGGKGLLILPDDTLSDVMPVLITNKFSVKVSNTPQIDNMVSPPDNLLPYGGLMGAAGSGVQSRKYGGKELDRENGLDWYDSQARHYDPTTGRTPTMDSKAESYYSLSPYLWCAGNPVRNIDPTGMYFDQATTNQAGLYIEQLNERIAELNHSNAEDRAEQLAEVARSLQDIEDMRNDEKRRYIFVSVVGVPETIQLADGSIQMNIDENMPGNYAHEIKHGGQIARNEFGYTNGHPDDRYGASHEVNAYKAQLSSCGQISYMPNYDFDANPNISLKIALLGQKSAWITVSNIKDISTTFLKSIYEGPGVHIWQLYSEKRYGKEWFEK